MNESGQILKRVNITSVDCRIAEVNYKLLARMYITPDRAHRIRRETSQLCWRGCNEIGTMAHIWWHCLEIKKYWDEIRSIIGEITNIIILDDPRICLVHGNEMPMKTYLKSLLPHLIKAAKSLIPRHWQDKRRPSIWEWLNKVNEIYYLEYLRFSEGTELEAFEMTWRKWVKYRYSIRAAEVCGI